MFETLNRDILPDKNPQLAKIMYNNLNHLVLENVLIKEHVENVFDQFIDWIDEQEFETVDDLQTALIEEKSKAVGRFTLNRRLWNRFNQEINDLPIYLVIFILAMATTMATIFTLLNLPVQEQHALFVQACNVLIPISLYLFVCYPVISIAVETIQHWFDTHIMREKDHHG